MLNIVNQTKSIPISWRYTHALNCVFPQGTLWRLWSQEMPWALGSVQLLSKPFFWRVWGPEWNLVYEWQGPDGIPRKHILRPLCQCNWWALLFVSSDRSSLRDDALLERGPGAYFLNFHSAHWCNWTHSESFSINANLCVNNYNYIADLVYIEGILYDQNWLLMEENWCAGDICRPFSHRFPPVGRNN